MDKTIRFIADARPDIVDFTIEMKAAQGVNVYNKTFLIAGLAIAIFVGVVAVFASGDPDGLESTAILVKG
jgi:hypothetical protein